MKTFVAFLKKEGTEQLRSGHIVMLGIIFLLFGIMNPAIAKITPWMLGLLSDSLAESGMSVGEIKVDALTSWTQFYKNIPIALIIFVLMTCGTLTGECQKGTLIPVLTKGLSRVKVLYAKLISLALLWSSGYWLCYFVTYVYNEYFWDNSIAKSLTAPSLAYYLFGLWVITLVMLFSTLSSSATGVLLGSGAICLTAYIIGMIPRVQKFTPMKLTDSMLIVTGDTKLGDLLPGVIVTVILSAAAIIASVIVFNKRRI